MSAENFDEQKAKPAKRKRQHHYHSEQEIAAKVDKANEKIRKYTAEAIKHEQKAIAAAAVGGTADAEFNKGEAKKFWEQVRYQQEVRLPKLRDLSGKLATALLPWDGNNDKSVAA